MGDKLKLCSIVSNISLNRKIVFIAVADPLLLLWQLKVSIDLQSLWEKWKLRFFAITLQIFWQQFYRNVPWVVLYQTYEFCPNRWIWLVVMATERINWWRNIKKSSPPEEAIRGMKLKLCRNVHNISLYKKFVFYCRCSCAFIAMATLSFHWLITRKVKVGLYCYLTAGILTELFFTNLCWVVLHQP